MEKLNDKKEINGLIMLFSITYMVTYIAKINFSAIISEIENATNISRDLLSLAITGSFITYGIGIILSGICGDIFKPKRLVTFSLTISVIMNLILPFGKSSLWFTTIWCINGFSQSFMWPPMVKIMVVLLKREDYDKFCTKVGHFSLLGAMLVYIISPLIITVFGWKAVFWFSAILGAVMVVFWSKYSHDVSVSRKQKAVSNNNTNLTLKPWAVGMILIAIIILGMLKDGVTTWMPTYIDENHNMGSAISILTGVVLPVFGMLSIYLASNLYSKKINNPLMCSVIFYLISFTSAVGLYVLQGRSPFASVLFFSLLTGGMQGVSLMLVSLIPLFFAKTGKTSTITGIVNSCSYVGSAISTYAIALLSAKYGWNTTVLSWCIMALAGTILCSLCVSAFKKFMEE